MNAMESRAQKRDAIDQHSRQAEEFAERYRVLEKDGFQDCFTYSRRRLNVWLDQALPISGNGLRVLDLGCGTGNQVAYLKQRGFEAFGVDGSPEMLAQARELNPDVEFRQADVESIPFPDNTFDAVLCIEVLRYLPDPFPCLREMARVLKPGGICLATAIPLFNLNGYWFVNRVASLMPVGDLVRLKQFFTTSSKLKDNTRKAGFSSVDIHGVYFGPINWIQRVFPWGLTGFLRRWEPIDAALADRWFLRDFSNMFLVNARK